MCARTGERAHCALIAWLLLHHHAFTYRAPCVRGQYGRDGGVEGLQGGTERFNP